MRRYMRFRRRCSESGQGSVEYIAMGLVVAVAMSFGLHLTGALTPLLQHGTASGLEKAICILFGDDGCERAGTEDPGNDDDFAGPPWQDPSLPPGDQATWGDYVALGDSYSSGEGGSEFEDGTDDLDLGCDIDWTSIDCGTGPEKNTCHRSTNAYGQLVSRGTDFEGDTRFAACSGAVIDDFTEPREDQYGEDPQLDNVDEDTSLITLSVGGNDAHFADVIEDCVKAGIDPTSHCSEDKEETKEGVDAVEDDLTALLKETRKKAPNARIVLVGYPRLFPDPPSDGDGNLDIDSVDQEYLNEMARRLGDVMAQAVENAGGSANGIEFVDAYDAFEGCEIGTDDSCMNGLKFGTIDGKPPVSAGSFHPNDRGHERLAELVERQIKEGL